jgi:hypothetical protein
MASLFQFSIRNLLVLVLFVAIGITALFNANGWWNAGLWGCVLTLLSAAILFAVHRREEQRAYWVGFAAFGWIYFALVLVSQWASQPDLIFVTRVANLAYGALPESRRTEWIGGSAAQSWSVGGQTGYMLAPPVAYSSTPGGGWSGPQTITYLAPSNGTVISTPAAMNPSYIRPAEFVQISHALALLIAAVIGGRLSKWLCRTSRPKQANA